MMASPFRILLLIAVVFIFGLGIYDYVKNVEDNGCNMTYMYQRPEYLKIPLPEKVRKLFPKYGLYLYAEGKYARESENSNFQLQGIPVLFIPGNAGSYRQVRSLGSVALEKAKTKKTDFHFNYFSIDFNEELSGLFGGYLEGQTEFTAFCIKHILTLYKSAAYPPKSVMLVGHSMGGVIARGVFTVNKFKAGLVNTIVTQATPHQHPVVNIDPQLNEYYTKINHFWYKEHNKTMKDVTIFSTGGGPRDLLVRHGVTSLNSIIGPDRGLDSLTMSVPRAWVSTDHLCHVWCNQIVLATKRAMFDIIDKKTKQVAVNPTYRLKVFHHHFERNPGPKTYKGAYDKFVELDPSLKWEMRKRNSWKFSRESVNKTRYSAMKLPISPEQDLGLVAISNIDNTNWFVACQVEKKEKQCQKATNFAPYANMIPPQFSEKKAVVLTPDLLTGFTHAIGIIPKSKKPTEITMEVFNHTARSIEYHVPTALDYFKNITESPFGREVVINMTERSALFYNISLIDLSDLVQGYTAHIINLGCNDQSDIGFAGTVAKFVVPWSREDTYKFIRIGQSGNISLKLHNNKPPGFPDNAQLHLFLHPSCRYHISITSSWTEILGQFVRFYLPLLPVFFIIQVLMTLSYQFKQIDDEGFATDFATAHAKWAQPFRVVPLTLLLRFLLRYPEEKNLSDTLGLPMDDGSILSLKGVWYQPVPIMLYFVAYASVELYAILVTMKISLFGRLLGAITNKCCDPLKGDAIASKFQFLLLGSGLGLAVSMCGSLGLVMCFLVFFLRTLSSYNISRLQQKSHPKLEKYIWTRFNINFSFMMLCLLMVILNGPSLVVWAQNLKFDYKLEIDPSFETGVGAVIATLILVLVNFPCPATEIYGVTWGILYLACVFLISFAMDTLYRANYFVVVLMLMVAVPLGIGRIIYGVPGQQEVVEMDDSKNGTESVSSQEEDEDASEVKEAGDTKKESKKTK